MNRFSEIQLYPKRCDDLGRCECSLEGALMGWDVHDRLDAWLSEGMPGDPFRIVDFGGELRL